MSTQNKGAYFDVVRLEQRLGVWDESAFISNLLQFLEKNDGITNKEMRRRFKELILEFTHQFRQHLLQAATQDFDEFFCSDKQHGDRFFNCSCFGNQLFEWNKNSRVVYHIDDDLRVLLQATSFHSATWDKIPWPFDSFVLALEKPTELKDGVLIDTIIFSKHHLLGKDFLFFSFLPVSLATYQPMSRKKKERIFLMLDRGNDKEVNKIINGVLSERIRLGVSYFASLEAGGLVGVPLSDLDEMVPSLPGFSNISQDLLVMVAAFALYLTTLPPGQPTPKPRNSAVPPAVQKQDSRLISAPSKVCHLTSAFKLTPEEKEGMEDAMRKERTGMVLPHWRRGFFRRPNGLGHDPTVPRTIWVRPTFVNKHHLPDGTLPGGAYVKVEGPEDDKV